MHGARGPSARISPVSGAKSVYGADNSVATSLIYLYVSGCELVSERKRFILTYRGSDEQDFILKGNINKIWFSLNILIY